MTEPKRTNIVMKMNNIDLVMSLQQCHHLVCTLPHYFCPHCYEILHCGVNYKPRPENIRMKMNISNMTELRFWIDYVRMPCPQCRQDVYLQFSD